MTLKLEHIDSSDSPRIVHYKHRPQAIAFMQMIENIERGTAMVRMPAGDGHATGEVHVGAKVDYHALAGDGPYTAVVTAVRGVAPDQGSLTWLVDLDVTIPGVHDPHHLTKIKCRKHP